jgi:hypothetical protein
VRGFTAGGSGTVSTEAIASNRPRTQIMHDRDFIPACTQVSNDNPISGVVRLAPRRDGSLVQGSVEWAKRFAGCPGFTDHSRNAEFDDSGRVVGNSYLGITSCLLVNWEQSRQLRAPTVYKPTSRARG